MVSSKPVLYFFINKYVRVVLMVGSPGSIILFFWHYVPDIE